MVAVKRCAMLSEITIPPEQYRRVKWLAFVADLARHGVVLRSRASPLTTPPLLLSAAFLRKWLGKPDKPSYSFYSHYVDSDLDTSLILKIKM
jgi:hypothetical protein